MGSKLEGTLQITGWDESPYSESSDSTKLSHAKITQTYTGAIEGSSELQYLMSYQSAQSAVFVGHEMVTGTLEGKSGCFILQHNGTFESGVAKSTFKVVRGSGTDELKNIEGAGQFTSGSNGQAKYKLEVSI